ncbi:MAG: PIN domain-containing protein [Verrucomicrobiota bacterium]
MTLFDTDILIYFQKGYKQAAKIIASTNKPALSQFSVLELLQGSQNAEQLRLNKRLISDINFTIMPLTQKVGDRASVLIEDFKLSHNLLAGDAIIAATALESGSELCTGNFKHFKFIPNIKIKKFTTKK